ncbi:hypothetical protein A2X44_01100 [candidate division CPR3 bacterium GWF2_35_18]|uniref:General secretion pathway protein G n=1 Tax=candidate division CPR3 bacterium GW2011_GWF2_35_18 TaxID=1618350 RepID=A0A0G0BLB5_UNCC3|nr:MAG: hypothetical protein UR67_C0001G0198 [candidate division CPR3 bacterium GW2011_GWF2_35_18]KKP85393.1 MAG: hypothetical protein UR87_C0052G0002 [candidate division CPR3 bacterium GW2011_GWE2_35_7]OGB63499.1 MAG: hypothetical protein A2X44_01100 [candidate division CPR3 bacterium GWF2_35_18]OGB64756.1 MAG: hypothetical protein A2250_04925 [candidate division CPR3 bacterium RIFOXYA2_FULL_35_13]OGB77364.1 MAG: hypothetical protein A2476_05625 [candidate division CPR3 bacterium RIFOXYC2_FULL
MKNALKGFTLIELLIVIAIIGVLTAIVVLAINPVAMIRKSRDSQRYANIKAIDEAIRLYIIDNGHAPYINNLCGPANPSYICYTFDFAVGWNLLEQDLSPYLGDLPVDPCGLKCFQQTGQYHSYEYYAPGLYKQLCMDNPTIPGCISKTDADFALMYVIYAETLEAAADYWHWGFGNNPWNSF